jgi:hypothetical protein
MNIAYKIFKAEPDGLASLIVYERAKVLYKQGERSFPPDYMGEIGYGLTVFESLETAELFSAEWKYTERRHNPIWEVEYGNILPLQPRLNFGFDFVTQTSFIPDGEAWPKGTLMVDWVELIRPMERKYYGRVQR